MTFLARLTRESSKNSELSENQQKYLKFANNSIHKEAVDYIESKQTQFYYKDFRAAIFIV